MTENKPYIWTRATIRYSEKFTDLIEGAMQEVGRPSDDYELGLNMALTRPTYTVTFATQEEKRQFNRVMLDALMTRRFINSAAPR